MLKMRWYFLLFLLFSVRVQACVCGGVWPTAKQAWREAPVVFLGTVEKAEPDGDPNETIFREQRVRIRVGEAFKGVERG